MPKEGKQPQDHKRSFAEIRALATRVTRKVTLCLAGDLNLAVEDLQTQIREAKDAVGETLGGDPRVTELEAELEDVRSQMLDASIDFVCRALPAKQLSDLIAAHPARKDDVGKPIDEAWNPDTFGVALVHACLTEPALTLPQVEELVDEVLNNAQWNRLWACAWSCNQSGVDVPPTSLASQGRNASETS
jgi:hypothetical protein